MKSQRGNLSRQIYLMITLIITLLIAGAAAYCLSWAKQAGDAARESILYLVECQPDLPQEQILALQSKLERSGWVRRADYISPDRAALLLAEDELDLEDVQGTETPITLPGMLSVYFRKEVFDDQAILDSLSSAIRQEPAVAGLFAQPDLAVMLQTNLNRIGNILLYVAVAILILSSFLMSSLFKLSLYADRREIKMMQLVGASPFAVRRPYLLRHISLACLSSIFVSIVLVLLHSWITKMPPWQFPIETVHLFLLLGEGIFILALILTLIVTYRVVNKYIFADIETLF